MRKAASGILLCLGITAGAQTPCSCAEDATAPVVMPDTLFILDSTMAIAYCGRIDRSQVDRRYSEFTLRWCTDQLPLLEADATRSFRIHVLDHALVAEDLRMLPSGKDLRMDEVVWRTHVIEGVYQPAIGEVVARISEVPGDLRSISAKEEKAIRERTKRLAPGTPWTDEQLLGSLFLSAANERRGAEDRFRKLRENFLFDGAYAEQYKELLAMLDVVVQER